MTRKKLVTATVSLFVAACLFNTSLSQEKSDALSHEQINAVQTFGPSDDAFVRSANPTGKYGSHSELRVRSPHSDKVNSYLKFNVSGIAAGVQQAKIRLFVLDGSVDGGSVYSGSNNFEGTTSPWTESDLIFNNAPAIVGAPLSSAGSVTTGSIVEFDVTAAITGDGVFSFVVANDHNDLVNYSSKEGSQQPELVIETGGPAPSTPTISSFTPTSGPIGTPVTIGGTNFVSVTSVSFNGVAAVQFTVDTSTQIRVTVPAGSTSGTIAVNTSAGSATSSSAFTVTSSGGTTTTLSFSPTDDSFVRSNRSTNNYGNDFDLRVRQSSSADFISYLKFNVAGLTGVVQQAKIRLLVIDESSEGGSVFAVSNNFQGTASAWTEGGLHYDNAPLINGSPLSSTSSASLNEVVEFDVTSAITGDGFYSFAIRSSTNDLASYSAKEGAQSPELVIQIDGDSGPPPPPPPAPTVTNFLPNSGPVGTEVTIAGTGFTGVNSVSFNSVIAAGIVIDSATQLRATVPAGASTGPVSVSNSNGAGISAQDFVVTSPDPDPDPDPDPEPGPSGTFTFAPVEDSFIRSNFPANNYGNADELRVRETSSADYITYLKFNVTGLTNTVQSATLRLFVIDASSDGGEVFSVSNNFNGTATSWNEGGLNATNAPAVSGSPLHSQGAVSLNQLVEFNVTAAINGDGVYSFALRNNANDLANYSSKEGVQIPELVIETGDGSSTTLPVVASFSPASGSAGTEVTIVGANFSGSPSGGSGGTVRIMPLGDSITQGVHGSTDNAGYRNDLAQLFDNNNIGYNFVGTRDHGSGFDSDHEGHSGFRADEIFAELNSYMNSNPPDMVIFHIGTNDISELQTPESTITEISNTLDAIRGFDAGIVTILSSVIPRNDSKNGATNTLNNYIRDLIPVKQNSGHNLIYAPMNEAFVANSNWATQYLDDGVHPNDTGYGVMSGVWFNKIIGTLDVTPGLTVAFNGVSASSVTIDSENQVRAIVPSGAATGKIAVTSALGTGLSENDFVVTGAALTFMKSEMERPSLKEIEAMVLGQAVSDSRGDLDGSGEVDLVDMLHLIDSDFESDNEPRFSITKISDAEASSAFRIEQSASGENSLTIAPSQPMAIRGLVIRLKFDPTRVRILPNMKIDNDHNLLVSSHVGGDFVTLVGYLKKAGESVLVRDVLVKLTADFATSALAAEGVVVAEAQLVAPIDLAEPKDESASENEILPTAFALLQNYPNPFNAGTEIKFHLPQRTRVSLQIFNVRGELVRTLVNQEHEPGQYRVHWDGKNEQGADAASGIYVYRLSTPSWKSSMKLTFVK